MSNSYSYLGKRDWWAKFLLAPVLVLLMGAGFWLLYSGMGVFPAPGMLVIQWLRPPFELALGVVIILIAAGLLGSLLGSRYRIGGPELVIGSSIDQRRVALSSIVEVVSTSAAFRNGWSRAPAWSRDLLRITYQLRPGRSTSVVVAPANKDEFLQALAEAAPQLRWTEDRSLRCASAN